MRNLLRQTLLSLVLLASARAAADDAAPHWGYKGATGPSHWAGLATEYQECKIGKFQSPIDIRGAKVAELPPIEFGYQAAPLHIINNGHTIQVNVPPGSFFNVGGKRYELVQFHFHHPSETKLGGQAFPLELHLVHKDADGKLAVVGVLLADGKANPTLAGLFKYIPKEKEKESAPDGVTVDPNGMLPTNRAYYTFPGSLTTPPCSEEVTWYVLRTPVRVSQHEVASFAAQYPLNARPDQPLNGRPVQMTK
jgi:carbonic anhydrase